MSAEEEHGGMVDRRGDLRHKVQREAHLIFVASLLESKTSADDRQHLPRLTGYTRNISMTGMSLIVPVVPSSDSYFYDLECTLQITLSLPTGTIQMDATPIRYEPLDKDGTEKGCLIGVRITKMNQDDEVRYTEYLRTQG